MNGTTSFDRTNYFQNVPTTALDLALWMESDRMGHLLPALSEAKFTTEREVVLNERRQNYENRPYGLSSVALAEARAQTINAAVEARILSSMKDKRVAASKILKGPKPEIDVKKKKLVKKVHDALYASKIISYAQGLDLITAMGAEKGWDLDLAKIAAIWRGGCIIRARFLNRITDAYRNNAGLANLMLDPFFKGKGKLYSADPRQAGGGQS